MSCGCSKNKTDLKARTLSVLSIALCILLAQPVSMLIASQDPTSDLNSSSYLAYAATNEQSDSSNIQTAYSSISEAQEAVERSAQDYEIAQQETSALESSISKNKARLQELQAALKEQQGKCKISIRDSYKLHRDNSELLNMILDTDSPITFFGRVEYLNRIQESYDEDIEELDFLYTENQETEAQLESDLDAAKERKDRAKASLDEAKEAREAMQKAALEAYEQEKKAMSMLAVSGTVGFGGVNIDWSVDKATFVEEWASRINDYLAGTPLSGQGETFANAAWKYGIDPRFSPAISCIESSKGKHCFLPYNAWGWGQVTWSSWEEAIPEHIQGLARGYGYTLSLAGAKKYCPPNWQFWYTRVGQEMGYI